MEIPFGLTREKTAPPRLGQGSLQMVQRYVHLGSSGTHHAMRAEFPHSCNTTAPDGPEQNHLTV
jgi:hypothetical protein